jgi:hypothetical protein
MMVGDDGVGVGGCNGGNGFCEWWVGTFLVEMVG